MKKILISIFVFFLIGFVFFFFLASQPTLSKSAYYQVTSYQSKPIANPPDTLTIMTYNLGYLSGMTNNLSVDREYEFYDSNMDAAVRLLAKLKPDIIGLQEVDFESARSFEQNQLDSLALRNNFGYSYRSVNWDKRYVPFPYWPIGEQFGKIVSGQSILSQFPISNDTTIRLIQPVNATFIYNRFYIDRLIQICDVKIGPVTMKVINLHLEAFDEETREMQAHVVKEVYERYCDKMAVLLIGDFNSRPVSETVFNEAMQVIMQAKNIASAIPDSVYSRSPESYYTFSSGEPYQMIDYILYNKNYIEMLESRVVNEAGEISDHLPVIAKFIFRAE